MRTPEPLELLSSLIALVLLGGLGSIVLLGSMGAMNPFDGLGMV